MRQGRQEAPVGRERPVWLMRQEHLEGPAHLERQEAPERLEHPASRMPREHPEAPAHPM